MALPTFDFWRGDGDAGTRGRGGCDLRFFEKKLGKKLPGMGNRYPINIKSTKKFCFDTDSPCQESVYGVPPKKTTTHPPIPTPQIKI